MGREGGIEVGSEVLLLLGGEERSWLRPRPRLRLRLGLGSGLGLRLRVRVRSRLGLGLRRGLERLRESSRLRGETEREGLLRFWGSTDSPDSTDLTDSAGSAGSAGAGRGLGGTSRILGGGRFGNDMFGVVRCSKNCCFEMGVFVAGSKLELVCGMACAMRRWSCGEV